MNSYLLFKSLHLIAVISWMAGLLYLPRIFVYHVENKEKKEATDIFEVMEKKLFYYIMRPAMIFSWIFGLVLIYLNGIEIFSQLWMQIKIVLIISILYQTPLHSKSNSFVNFNSKSLSKYFSGIVAAHEGDLNGAIELWEKALYLMPPDHPDRNIIEEALDTVINLQVK